MNWNDADEVREEARRLAIEADEDAFADEEEEEEEPVPHAEFVIDHDERGAQLLVKCPTSGELEHLDEVERDDQVVYNRAIGWHTELRSVWGTCTCGTYLEVDVAPGEASFNVTCEEPADA